MFTYAKGAGNRADYFETEPLAAAYYLSSHEAALTEPGRVAAEVRADMSPQMAAALRIDITQPLTTQQAGHLMSGRRADGGKIAGRMERSGTVSLAEVFGLDAQGTALPSGQAMQNIRAGLRADGAAPRYASGNQAPISDERIAGALKRWHQMLKVPAHRQANETEQGHIANGLLATGNRLTSSAYRRLVNATGQRVDWVDFQMAADKSFATAWALAPSSSERATLLKIQHDAAVATLAYVEHDLGFARRGDGGKGGVEKAEMTWMLFQHLTSRPTLDVTSFDERGEPMTETVTIPTNTADPQPHLHAVVPNTIRTASGHIGSLDLDMLEGKILEWGAVFQAYVAREARSYGIQTVFEDGFAKIPGVERDLFSKRSLQGEAAARAYAAGEGNFDYDALKPEQRAALLRAKTARLRQKKEALTDAAADWQRQADGIGYQHRSVLRPDEIQPELAEAQRHAKAYEVGLPALAKAVENDAAIGLSEMRIIVARTLIVAGIDNPAEDIQAVVEQYFRDGIKQDGERADLIIAEMPMKRGKPVRMVTTGLHERQEKELIALAKALSADRSSALKPALLDQAVERYLARHQKIDPAGEHWKQQRAMMTGISASRLSLGVGASGSGKSTVITALTDAWQHDGRRVIYSTQAWKHLKGGAEAGIERQDRIALDPLIRGIKSGKITVDRQTVLVLDEVALIGTRQLLQLVRLQAKHQFQFSMIGDAAQMAAIEAGNIVGTLEKALPGSIPALVNSIRQKLERDRETVSLWRHGHAAEALERKQEDGDLVMVTGGRQAVIDKTADTWMDLMRRNGDAKNYELLAIVPSNADVKDVSDAIRLRRRDAGEIGEDIATLKTVDRSGVVQHMAIAAGDVVRLQDRVFDSRIKGRDHELASNGDTVRIMSADSTGMLVRNEAGVEGQINWRKLQQHKTAPIRLSHGLALTSYLSQGLTATDSISAFPDGTAKVGARSIHVSDSRQKRSGIIIGSHDAEWHQIGRRQVRGADVEPITSQDVLANMAQNLLRKSAKLNALDVLREAVSIKRGGAVYRPAAKNPSQTAEPTVADFAAVVALSEIVAWRGAASEAKPDHPKSSHLPKRTQQERDAARAAAPTQPLDEAQRAAMRQQSQHRRRPGLGR